MWRKKMEEIVCMATQVSSFSLNDGDDTSCVVMKFTTSNRGKQEIVIMGYYLGNVVTMGVYLAMQATMDPCNELYEWHPMPH
jgi:hypothetical protein